MQRDEEAKAASNDLIQEEDKPERNEALIEILKSRKSDAIAARSDALEALKASRPAQQVQGDVEHVPITSGFVWKAIKTSLVAKFAPSIWHQLLLIALTIANAMMAIYQSILPFWVKTVFIVGSLLLVLIMFGLNVFAELAIANVPRNQKFIQC